MNHEQLYSIYLKLAQRYPEIKQPNSALLNTSYDHVNEILPGKLKSDIEFFREAFDPLVELKIKGRALNRIFSDNYGTFYGGQLHVEAIRLLYPNYLKASLSFDEICEETIELNDFSYGLDIKNAFSKDSLYRKQSYIFKPDGTTRSPEFLLECSGKYQLGYLLEHIFTTDDARALNYLLENNPFKDRLKGSRLTKAIKRIDIPPTSDCNRVIFGEAKETPFSYLQKLLNVGESTSLNDLDALYNPDMAKEIGHEFFYHRLQRKAQSQVEIELFSRLVRDGADWYCGFKQALLGHHAMYSFRDCDKSLREKLDDYVASNSKIWSNGRSLPVSGVAALFRAFPADELKPSLRSATDAKRLYIMTNDMSYLAMCSNKEKRNFLDGDLGI